LSAEPRGRCSDFDGGGSFHLDSKDQSAQCRHPGEFMQLPRETGIEIKSEKDQIIKYELIEAH